MFNIILFKYHIIKNKSRCTYLFRMLPELHYCETKHCSILLETCFLNTKYVAECERVPQVTIKMAMATISLRYETTCWLNLWLEQRCSTTLWDIYKPLHRIMLTLFMNTVFIYHSWMKRVFIIFQGRRMYQILI